MMAREGAKVMACARRKERLDQWKQEMTAEGHSVDTFVADAGDSVQMEALAKATAARFGTIQVMVYATGTNTLDRTMKRLRPDVWNEMMSTNLNGAFYATYAVLPAMREARFGHIIYLSSISGHTPDVSGAAYQASKRALIGLSYAVRLEEKENGIRTTVINPGLINTELLEKRPVKPTPEMLAQAMSPEHVAEAVMICAKMPPKAVIPEMTIVPSTL
jgi:serine 3-dehydrogenase (NADP+)